MNGYGKKDSKEKDKEELSLHYFVTVGTYDFQHYILLWKKLIIKFL